MMFRRSESTFIALLALTISLFSAAIAIAAYIKQKHCWEFCEDELFDEDDFCLDDCDDEDDESYTYTSSEVFDIDDDIDE